MDKEKEQENKNLNLFACLEALNKEHIEYVRLLQEHAKRKQEKNEVPIQH